MSASLQAYAALVKGHRLLRGGGGWRALIDALPAKRERSGTVDAETIAAACDRAARRLPLDTRCLERSYATCSVLRRHGASSVLCVGVSRLPPMRFHAWVEVDGTVLNEGQPVRDIYRVICAL